MTPWQLYKQNAGKPKPWDLLNPNVEKATDLESSTRLGICEDCPEFVNLTKQCKQCSCIMPLKVKLKEVTCPIGKW